MSLGDVLRMPAPEYDALLRHFTRHPPGDTYTHYLLAQLWAVFVSAHSAKPVSYLEVAPWLAQEPAGTPGERRQRGLVLQTMLHMVKGDG